MTHKRGLKGHEGRSPITAHFYLRENGMFLSGLYMLREKVCSMVCSGKRSGKRSLSGIDHCLMEHVTLAMAAVVVFTVVLFLLFFSINDGLLLKGH